MEESVEYFQQYFEDIIKMNLHLHMQLILLNHYLSISYILLDIVLLIQSLFHEISVKMFILIKKPPIRCPPLL